VFDSVLAVKKICHAKNRQVSQNAAKKSWVLFVFSIVPLW
jgi:hypothetical protein